MSSYNRPTTDFESFIDFNGGFDHSNYAEENQTFSGPSHEYDRFRQQTGLPAGAMANVSTYNDMNIDTDFNSPSDFSRSASDMSGYGSGMNFDFNQTPQSATYPSFYQQSSNMNDFIDPSAVYEAPRPVRMYPGMHTQQAEQKAAAMAKQQSLPPQMQQPSLQSSNEQYTGKGKARAGSQPAVDPVADRRISEILDNMRHRSAMSPIDENDGNADAMARQKKEDDEMDEDERLLASEEGKKLSSKERRQLRNKVSARAFRSRRKEYIGQLEGDLAAKATEAHDLKMFNRKLLAENNQLKNFTRTILSHPSFSTFLEDMSRHQTFIAGPAPQHMHMPTQGESMAPQPQPQPQNEIKQEPEVQQQTQPQQQQQTQYQDQTQVNKARLPESSLDMSMLNLGANNHWSQYQQPQIFAVFDLPTGPSMEELKQQSVSVRSQRDRAIGSRVQKTPRPTACHCEETPSSGTDFSFTTLNARLEQSLAISPFTSSPPQALSRQAPQFTARIPLSTGYLPNR